MGDPPAHEPLPSRSHVLVHPLSSSSARAAHDLVHAIRNHSRHDAAPPPSPPSPRPRSTSPHYSPWRISNKYYRASVAFRVMSPSDADLDQEDDLRTSLSEGDEPAVVVVAPASALPSPTVLALLERLSSRDPEFDVALLVTHPPSPAHGASATSTATQAVADGPTGPGAGAGEMDEAAWDDAALSAGFEWVHLGPAPRAASGNGQVDAEDEEDGESPVGRVVAALHAHMWDGMERVERPARAPPRRSHTLANGTSGASVGHGEDNEEDEDDAEDWSALSAPPLPAPRVRPGEAAAGAAWAFPERFLPSIARSTTDGSGAAGEDDVSAAAGARTSSSFEDDFAPFVSATSSSTSFDANTTADAAAGTSALAHDAGPLGVGGADAASIAASPPYRHPSLAFPDSTSASITSPHPLLTDDPSLDPADTDLDSLDDLFSRLSTARAATASMDLDERRAYAERVVRELLGEDALAGLSGSDGEGEES
ncbi:hypothetical protein JCM3775_006266 [Rhodotorula graminis]